MNKKILPALGLALLLAGILSGCSSGARATNWTGLTVGEEVVYAANLQNVVALDAESGEQVWAYPLEELREVFYNVSLFDGTLLVASYEPGGGLPPRPANGVLRALSAEDGRSVWSERIARNGDFAAAGAVSDGILVIGNSNGDVYGFRTESGAEVWSFPTNGRVWASPLVLDGVAYVASLDHKLYALDLQTGQQHWAQPFQAGGAILSSPLPLDGRLYVGAFDRKIYALHQEDGSTVWAEPFEGEAWFWSRPTTDGTSIYAVDVNGTVYALDATTGAPRWDEPTRLDEPVRLDLLMSADNSILLAGGDLGTLYALDAEDGQLLWTVPGGGRQGQLASMAVHEDVLYLTRLYSDQTVEAFRITRDGGELLWQYPPPESEE